MGSKNEHKNLRYATTLPTITIVKGGEYLYNKFDFKVLHCNISNLQYGGSFITLFLVSSSNRSLF